MVFSSIIFLFFFFPFVLSLYFLLHPKLHNGFLLLSSLVFCAWGANELVFVLIAVIVLNYVCALGIDNGFKKIGLIASLIGNIGLLVFFKYFNFIFDNLDFLSGTLHLPLPTFHKTSKIALPLGISFYTFKALSYIIDVYWGETKANKNVIDFGMFMTMFPQLVAGPIVRYIDVAAQLTERALTSDRFIEGIRRFILGLGKKVLIASTVAVPVDQIFALPAEHLTPGIAWFGLVCYTIQIYFDFSGYSDMAIGIGKMLGFDFLENFDYPYISRSIQEFWTRWHISLSTWFRDYLYLPLAFSNWGRVNPRRLNVIVVFVFLVTGIWHGAAWNFVLWGGYHGIFLVVERVWLGKKLSTLWRPFAHLYTLLVVMVGWVIFRAETIEFALYYLKAVIGIAGGDGRLYSVASYLNNYLFVMITIGLIGSTPLYPFFKSLSNSHFAPIPSSSRQYLRTAATMVSIISFAIIFLLCAMSLSSGTYNPFIYFRF